jgi:hypothetical protein
LPSALTWEEQLVGPALADSGGLDDLVDRDVAGGQQGLDGVA